MTLSRILILLSGLLLAAGARAGLPASLEQAAAQVAGVPTQGQALVADLEGALKSGVAEQDLQSVMRLAAAQKYSAAHAAAFVRQLAAVRRDDLPVALVRDKILEGMAKKVPAESILSVTSQWQGALKDAASTVLAMEGRGLKYDKAGEREALIDLGAGLRQRYGVKDALPGLAESAMEGGRMASGAGNLIAAGNLAELLLLHNAAPAQALELPMASLRAGYTSAQIQALQRTVLNQLRQGVAPVDVVAGMRRQLGPKADTPPAKPAFSNPGQPPGGSWPGGPPGGGGAPGGMPGGGFPGGGGSSGMPGGGFPGGGFPRGGGGY
ncbi:MAG: hypothetical protein M1547_13985 [Gammaproteobacteria bacterium]|nr:hypothetical protein [Gammaproteobacteria bacterium]